MAETAQDLGGRLNGFHDVGMRVAAVDAGGPQTNLQRSVERLGDQTDGGQGRIGALVFERGEERRGVAHGAGEAALHAKILHGCGAIGGDHPPATGFEANQPAIGGWDAD